MYNKFSVLSHKLSVILRIVVLTACAGFMLSCQGNKKENTSDDAVEKKQGTSHKGGPGTEEEEPQIYKDTNYIEPEMVFVKGGHFTMGSNKTVPFEKPAHTVTLSNFRIGKYEVTVGEFRKFMNTHRYLSDADKDGYSYVWDGKDLIYAKKGVNWECDIYGNKHVNEEDHPVIHVSHYDAQAYCDWLSSRTGKTYRLLTEAEWEYAAKGGHHHDDFIYSGSDTLANVGWYSKNSDLKTHPVGQKEPNRLGVYDMSGNVWEWCADWYGDYTAAPQSDPKGPATGNNRVLRGGAWRWFDIRARNTARRDLLPHFNASGIGFRLAASE